AAAAALVEIAPATTFLSALRRGNVHGAIDMGLAPGLLPGRVSLDDGREWYDEWGELPATRGRDTAAILTAAAAGELQTLVLLGADPLADFPDRDLARRALDGAGTVIAVDSFLTESSSKADVVLPAATYAEKSGTTTNLEGRVSRLNAKVTPPGTARPDWMIAVELASRMGGDLGFESLDGLWDEIERLAPSHEGITRARLATSEGLDGIVTGHGGVGRDAGDDDGPARPAPLRWSAASAPAEPPQVDSYSLRLVVTRKLYDGGTSVQRSPSLAPLAAPAALRVNPTDLDRLGLTTGAKVRVTSSRTTLDVDAVADAGVPRGSAQLAWGAEAAELIDSSAAVTDARVETLS
ncbi:MAG: NADH-quinone oxidoreductase subunit, partial [Actinomycetota bacterium]|nr:NADH-quinone oxidoreductase subunit [Actinomycetota bacterium]